MTILGVIGNISRDLATYPGGRRYEMLGGAALHVARAATRAGLAAAPISVIGTDLAWIKDDPRLAGIDLSHVAITPGSSCAFRLTYTTSGQLTAIGCSFGAASALTRHALLVIGSHDAYHVCCRRPLDASAVLGRMAAQELAFSVDFHLASATELVAAAAPFLSQAVTVFTNAAEFAALSSLADPAALNAVVITDGPGPVTLMRHGRVTATATPPHACLVEATGAGDTLTGAFLAATRQGLDDQHALTAAVEAATPFIQAPGLDISDNKGWRRACIT